MFLLICKPKRDTKMNNTLHLAIFISTNAWILFLATKLTHTFWRIF